jgi:hypothetical protein
VPAAAWLPGAARPPAVALGVVARPAGLPHRAARPVLIRRAPAGDQAAHGGDEQDPGDDRQRHPGADLGHRHGPEVVDAVGPQRLADELEPDEGEDGGQARGQIHQPVQQAADEEIQVPQAEQREQVGGEDQERVAGQAEDRRDGVDGEQHVGHPDGDDQDEQRRGVAASPHPGGQPRPVALGRDRHDAARDPQPAAAPRPGRIGAAERQPGRGVDEEPPEEIFHPGELLQGGTANGDEQAAQQQGEQDPEQQHPAVVPECHPGAADQQDEHQEVVERQAVFGQPAGEELARRRPAAHGGEQHAERHRQGDRPRRPQRRLAQPLRSAPPGADEQVGAQENGKGRDGRGPGPEGYVEDTHGIRVPAIPAPASRTGRRAGSRRESAPRPGRHPR